MVLPKNNGKDCNRNSYIQMLKNTYLFRQCYIPCQTLYQNRHRSQSRTLYHILSSTHHLNYFLGTILRPRNFYNTNPCFQHHHCIHYGFGRKLLQFDYCRTNLRLHILFRHHSMHSSRNFAICRLGGRPYLIHETAYSNL